MGIFVNIMIFIFEVAFTAYCIKTKDNRNKIRSWISIVAFITFIGCILTSIIDWGFQVRQMSRINKNKKQIIIEPLAMLKVHHKNNFCANIF